MNQKYIVRCDRSGVFFGEIEKRECREVTMRNVRCLWYLSGAASLIQLAKEGVRRPNDCKFTVTLDEITVLDAIEILPCSSKAVTSVEGVKEWKA